MTDIGYDLEVPGAQRQASTRGVWVTGKIAGRRFEALVFEQRAQRARWELCTSRIAKLWLKRPGDGRVVFSRARGAAGPAADATAGEIVDFLTAGLADPIFAR